MYPVSSWPWVAGPWVADPVAVHAVTVHLQLECRHAATNKASRAARQEGLEGRYPSVIAEDWVRNAPSLDREAGSQSRPALWIGHTQS